MSTKTAKQFKSWLHANCDSDLYRITHQPAGKVGNRVRVTLLASNEFSDKLERKCEKAGFTIINWTSNNYEHDIEIEVAK